MSTIHDFDFRPREVTEKIGVHHFEKEGTTLILRDDDVEGCGRAELLDDGTWACGYYIWTGDVGRALREEVEKFAGCRLEWRGFSNNNGHCGGYLVPVEGVEEG